MYNGVKHGLPGFMALTGFRLGWLALAAATLWFVGVAVKNLAKRHNELRP